MRKLFTLIGASSLAIVPIVEASAQTTSDPSDGSDAISEASTSEIPVIVVTAQKRQQALSDVGQTINVVDAQQLARQGVTSVADLTKIVPGLTVATNPDATPIYTLRGVSFNVSYFGAQPTVSVYIDEAPLAFPIMTEGAILDLERVEILKGPQGTLFGQNSTAGAINYIAAKPTSEFTAGAKASFGRFDSFQSEAFISGPLTDTFKARFAISSARSGAWQKSATRDDALGQQRKVAGRLLFDWEPNEQFSIAFNLNGWLDKSDTPAPQFVEPRPSVPSQADPQLFTRPITATSPRNADWDPGKSFRRDNNFYQAALRADYEFSDQAVLTSLGNYTRAKIHSFSDYDGTSLNFSTTLVTGYAEAVSQELRLSGMVAGETINYIIGGSFQHDKSLELYRIDGDLASAFRNVGAIPNLFPGFGSFRSIVQRGQQSNRTWAGFANIDWEMIDQLTLSAGFRYTAIKHDATGCTLDSGDGTAADTIGNLSTFIRSQVGLPASTAFRPGGCVTLGPTFEPFEQNDSFKEDSVSWRFNANYKVDPDILFYATVSRGYKGGNYPVPAASSFVQLAAVQQEKLTAYEGGLKSKLFNRRLAINASVYYYDYRNKQLQTNFIDPIYGQLLTLANIPKSEVIGFDADALLVPIDGLTLRTAVTYADTEIGRYSGFDVAGVAVDLTGNPFNYAPKWISVGDVEFERGISDRLHAFVGASYTYNSKTFADLAGSESLRIRSFGVLDLRAGIGAKSKAWEVMAYIRNATNEYYWNYARTGADSVLRYANLPITYGLTLSSQF